MQMKLPGNGDLVMHFTDDTVIQVTHESSLMHYSPPWGSASSKTMDSSGSREFSLADIASIPRDARAKLDAMPIFMSYLQYLSSNPQS